jgi:uncharacterized phage protein (TIGR01671 family)
MKANRFRFRVWIKTTGQMAQVTELLMDRCEFRWFIGARIIRGGSALGPDDVVLMQSTGLLDANGVEIFEGDVVANGEKCKGYIKWVGPAFHFDDQGTTWHSWPFWEGIRVIGHIYQPEFAHLRES